jgi:hypothetical protein
VGRTSSDNPVADCAAREKRHCDRLDSSGTIGAPVGFQSKR